MKNILLTISVFIYTLGFSQNRIDSLVFNHINEYRRLNGIHPLDWDTVTYRVGVDQVDFMTRTNLCTHDQTRNEEYNSSLFREKFRKNGVQDDKLIAENLTLFNIDSTDICEEEIACKIFNNWINSKSHHELLLDKDIYHGSITHTMKKNAVIVVENPETYELIIYNMGDVVYAAFECTN